MATLDSFLSNTQLSTSIVSLVSTNNTEKKFLGKVTFTNTSVSKVVVTVWRLPTATTPVSGSGGNWLDIKTIQPGKVWECDKLESHVLGNSMTTSAQSDTGSVINADLSGVTES